MPVNNKKTGWKFCLTLDGYASHLVPSALKSFTDSNIEVIKEEGDTSQVNQAYDQSVVKEDKKHISYWLDKFRCNKGFGCLIRIHLFQFVFMHLVRF